MNKGFKIYITFIVLFFSGLQVKSQQKDLTLSSAIEKALENNYGITIAKSETNIATLNNNWGTAGRYPTVDFSASTANNYEFNDSVTTNRLSFGIGLNWTIFNGFKVIITKEKLENLEKLAHGRSAVIVENTIQDIITGYYNILLQKEKLNVLNKVMLLSKDRFDYEMAKQEIGSSVTYNVLQAKNVYLEDKAAYLNQEVVVRNTVRSINFLMGEDASSTWNFTDDFNADTSNYILGDLMEKMLSNNQSLQNQYINLLLQQKEIELQKSALYPRLSLSAGVDNSYTWKDPGNTTNPLEILQPYANLSLSYEIYAAGNRRRAIDIAKINEEISQVETEEMKHSLTNQLLNEFDMYNLRKTILGISKESVETAELNLQIANEKFRAGTINSFNYRDIQLNYLNSALNQLQSVYNLIYSNTSLTRLTGGFLEETR